MSYRRSTGTWTDLLRRAWAELGRRPRLRGINRWGHRAYDGWEHLRYAASLTADAGSFARYLRLARRREPGPVRVRVKPLGGATMAPRPGTTDAVSLRDTFRDRVHVPPPELEPDRIRHIVDLGVNIGATMAHNAVLHPGARIVGVELDPRTAELARLNVAAWADRCQVLQGAVWVADGEVVLAGDREDGFRAVDPATARPDGDRTRALSMETILQQLPA